MTTKATKTKCVGFWAVQVTLNLELIKWGQNDDTQFPYRTAKEALVQLRHLSAQNPDDRYYILKLFNNGQMVTYEYDQ